MGVSKYVTKDGKVRWIVTIYTGGRGSKRIKKHFDKKVDAETFERETKSKVKESDLRTLGVGRCEETTFRVEAENWIKIQGSKFSAGHFKRVNGILNGLLPLIGDFTPDKLHSGFLVKLQADLARNKKCATVNREIEVITAVLNFAFKTRRIPFHPAVGFVKLKEVREEMKFWEKEEATSFLKFANERFPVESESRWIYVVYLLALNTGLRAGEIWGLMPHDIVEQGEVLLIRRQFDRVKKDFSYPKGKRARRVPCNPELLKELQALIRDRKIGSHETIFQNESGKPVNHDYFAEHFSKVLKMWGGQPIRFHDLRHTATTLMIEKFQKVVDLKKGT